MIKLIIFDWDDVFTLGSTAGYIACYHRALARVGVSLDPVEERKRILAKWGQPFREELAELLQEYPEKIDEAARAYEQSLSGETFLSHLTLVPGAAALLKRLKGRYLLAIASGINPSLFVDRILVRFNIPYIFNDMMSVYNVPKPEYGKPHPYLVNQLLARLNVAPENTILVGDSEGDMKMARAAGVEPVAVLTGHLNREQAAALGVKYIIQDVSQLENILVNL